MTRAPGLSCADAADLVADLLAVLIPEANWQAARHHPPKRRLTGTDQLARQMLVYTLVERFGFAQREVAGVIGVDLRAVQVARAGFDTLPPAAADAFDELSIWAADGALFGRALLALA